MEEDGEKTEAEAEAGALEAAAEGGRRAGLWLRGHLTSHRGRWDPHQQLCFISSMSDDRKLVEAAGGRSHAAGQLTRWKQEFMLLFAAGGSSIHAVPSVGLGGGQRSKQLRRAG